jgi:DNA polymerase III epsilon subunit-like protein
MFRQKVAIKRQVDEQPEASNRVVYLYIKTTDFYKEEPDNADVDRLTEISMHEYIDGKKTKNEFHSFVNPGDDVFLQRCLKTYRDNLEADHAAALCKGMSASPRFSEIQKSFFDFLRKDNASVVIHTKPRVLKYLRKACDEHGVAILKDHRDYMIDIIIEAKKLAKAGLYHARKYNAEVDKDSDAVLKDTKAGFTFSEICDELGPRTIRRDTWSADYDVGRLALSHMECKRRLDTLKEAPEPIAMKKRK